MLCTSPCIVSHSPTACLLPQVTSQAKPCFQTYVPITNSSFMSGQQIAAEALVRRQWLSHALLESRQFAQVSHWRLSSIMWLACLHQLSCMCLTACDGIIGKLPPCDRQSHHIVQITSCSTETKVPCQRWMHLNTCMTANWAVEASINGYLECDLNSEPSYHGCNVSSWTLHRGSLHLWPAPP